MRQIFRQFNNSCKEKSDNISKGENVCMKQSDVPCDALTSRGITTRAFKFKKLFENVFTNSNINSEKNKVVYQLNKYTQDLFFSMPSWVVRVFLRFCICIYLYVLNGMMFYSCLPNKLEFFTYLTNWGLVIETIYFTVSTYTRIKHLSWYSLDNNMFTYKTKISKRIWEERSSQNSILFDSKKNGNDKTLNFLISLLKSNDLFSFLKLSNCASSEYKKNEFSLVSSKSETLCTKDNLVKNAIMNCENRKNIKDHTDTMCSGIVEDSAYMSEHHDNCQNLFHESNMKFIRNYVSVKKIEQLLGEIAFTFQVVIVALFWLVIYRRRDSTNSFLWEFQYHGMGLILICFDYYFQYFRDFSLKSQRQIVIVGVSYMVFHWVIVKSRGYGIYPPFDFCDTVSYVCAVTSLVLVYKVHKFLCLWHLRKQFTRKLKNPLDFIRILLFESPPPLEHRTGHHHLLDPQ